jgi:hypothetical protein
MRKTLIAPAFPAQEAAQLAAALRVLAKILAPFLAEEMHTPAANDLGEWVDQCRSPLGRRLHCAAARSGKLAARKVGRRWLVRRADLETFIATHGAAAPARTACPSEGADSGQDERLRVLLAECGAELCAPPADTTPGRQTRRRR